MFVYAFGKVWLIFAFAEVIAAVGHCLQSGALDAWMKSYTSEDEGHLANARGEKYGQLAGIPAGIVGAWVAAQFGLEWPWVLSGTVFLVSAILTILLTRNLPEWPDNQERVVFLGWIQMFKHIWVNVGYMISHYHLRFILITTFFSAFAFQPFNMFWPVIVTEAGIPLGYVGLVWAGVGSLSALGNHLATWNRLPRNGLRVGLALATIGFPMVLTPGAPNLVILVSLFLFHEVGRGLLTPLMYTYSNRHMNGATRSEGNSIKGSAQTAGSALGLFLSGAMTKFMSPRDVWGIAAVIILTLAVYSFTRRRS